MTTDDTPKVGVIQRQAAAVEARERIKLENADARAQGDAPQSGDNYTDLEILALAQAAGGTPSQVTERATAYKKWMTEQ